MSTCCEKLISKPYLYGDDTYLSQPFKFIGLPLYSVLLFILYWFIYCPLMFVKVYYYYAHTANTWTPLWPYYFWLVALAVFLILLAILVTLWKLTPKRNDRLFKVDYVEDDKVSLVSELEKKLPENDETEVKFEKTPMKLNLHQDEKIEMVNEQSPLTPRELFFYDLIESANKSFNSSPPGVNRNSESEQEFFIANVSPTSTCVSNIFMFVNPSEAQPAQDIVKDVHL